MRTDYDRHDHHQLDYGEAPGRFQSTHADDKVKPEIHAEQAFSCTKRTVCAKSKRGPRKKTAR